MEGYLLIECSDLLVQFNEADKQFALEFSTSAGNDQVQRLIMSIGFFVRAFCTKRIVGIGKPDGVCVRGYLIAGKTVWVTVPIPTLVVMAAHVIGITKSRIFYDSRNGDQNAAALDGVCFHQLILFGSELSGFAENR